MTPGDTIEVPIDRVQRVVKPTADWRVHHGLLERKGDWILFNCPDCEVLTQARGNFDDRIVMCHGCKLVFMLEKV